MSRPRRFVGLLASIALVGACSGDDAATTTPVASTPVAPTGDDAALIISGTGSDATTDELGVTITIIEARMRSLGVGGTVSTETGTITIAITDDAGLSADELVTLLTTSGALLLRPVLSCVDEGGTSESIVASAPTDPAATLTLPLAIGGGCEVGPARATGEIFEPGSAQPQIITGAWGVAVRVRDGAGGLDLWNAAAASCFEATPVCPSSRLAIELDGLIVSAPTVASPSFGSEVQISGAFTETEAEALALSINAGALPLAFGVTSVERT